MAEMFRQTLKGLEDMFAEVLVRAEEAGELTEAQRERMEEPVRPPSWPQTIVFRAEVRKESLHWNVF